MTNSGGLLVVGDVLTDVTVTGLSGSSGLERNSDTPAGVVLGGGGAAANTAAWAAALGVPTTFAGRVGNDAWGKVAGALLRGVGVRTALSVDAELATGTCVVLVRADSSRDLVVSPGASSALVGGELPDPALFDWVHVSGYPLLHEGSRTAAATLLRAAITAGVPCSVDPASVAPLRGLGVARFADLVSGVDVLFPNAAEAELLTGLAEPEAAGRALLDLADEVVVTLGADGSLAIDRSGRLVRVAADSVDAVDTTGAGDAFAAGWLAARLAGADSPGRLRAATACAARVVVRVGTRPPDRPLD